MNKKSLWIGIGIGTAAGFAGGFIVGNQVTKRAARKDLKKIRHEAYIKGRKDGKRDVEGDVIVVDSTDPNAIQKAIEEHFESEKKEEKEEKSDDEESHSKALKDEKATDSEKYDEKTALNDDIYGVKDDEFSQISKALPMRLEGQYVIFIGAAGTEIRYPKSLVIDPNTGRQYDTLQLRENFKSYENDIQKLRLIWHCLGWGTYEPLLDGAPTPEEIDNWDLSIGDESMDEPEVKTEERRKYVESLKEYRSNPDAGPLMISRQDFEEECYLDKEYYDYYELDNVFIKNDDINDPVDAFTLFGTNNGQELFDRPSAIADDDYDPDIVHIKNFKMNCVAEITRFHKAYAGLKDGTAFMGGVG